ncbi:TetR/AcrR family transcriptional regulator [Microtetraspora sp. AC03309]|uniref:TetR/AcrR family transcriptional regulator n=1 Tax=Microtetraspora sp. AC03309 TaxID=2779376 RepID=UPI001E64989F|nr:TetR/AcrR family transcriptional regulator [Microtetraspora sp. AC03309]
MSDDQTPGPARRVPREEVRRRLLAEAARVFAERGYVDARLEDIAHAAGFTKGAVYSNFGSKQELFAAVLSDGAEMELAAVMTEIRDTSALPTLIARVSSLVTRRIVGDTRRGYFGLEFAARAARDDRIRSVLTPMRRTQREGAARSIAEAAERTGARPSVDPDLAALILHCLTNGLTNEHLADPEKVNTETIERALSTVLFCLLPPDRDPVPQPSETGQDERRNGKSR